MSAALFPEPEEPGGSGLPGDQGEDGWDAEEGTPQGLYVTLPAEELSLEGFAQDGRADTMAPGPLLATVLDAVAGEDGAGLAGMADDQLIGFLSGARRMASRLEWARMAALAEFASRPRRDDFAADEVAAAFRLAWLSAAGEIQYSQLVAKRLPVTFALLAAGKLDPAHVRIIEDVTSILSDEDAAVADARLAEVAQSRTYAELRRAANRLVAKLDPDAVRKRKEKARHEVHVRAFREESGNAGITGREMSSVEVLASMQHLEGRARALRDAGVAGTWEELKARAFLDLLQERDSRPMPGEPAASGGSQDAGEAGSSGPDPAGPRGSGPGSGDPGPGGHDSDGSGPDESRPDGPETDGPGPGDRDPGDSGPDNSGPDNSGPGGPGPGGRDPGPAPRPGPAGRGRPADGGPSVGALITITVPHTALTGNTGPPGEIGGFGILDHADTRDLVAAAARNPATRWCLTTLHPDGTAATHDCATGPHRWPPGQGPPGQGPPGQGPPGQGPPGPAPPEPVTLRSLLDLLNLTGLTPIIRGPCEHDQAECRYPPSRKLTHRIKARNTTCTAPGCGRRAACCDLDHTDPYDNGGLTCECNLAPLCRHHHRCKQAEGWRLEQPEPGVLVWHTPAGRTYTTTPTPYAA